MSIACWPRTETKSLVGLNRHSFIQGLSGLQARRHRFKRHLSCVPPDPKMGKAFEGQNHKLKENHISFLSEIKIGAGER